MSLEELTFAPGCAHEPLGDARADLGMWSNRVIPRGCAGLLKPFLRPRETLSTGRSTACRPLARWCPRSMATKRQPRPNPLGEPGVSGLRGLHPNPCGLLFSCP